VTLSAFVGKVSLSRFKVSLSGPKVTLRFKVSLSGPKVTLSLLLCLF
jgi:hypothetical protein